MLINSQISNAKIKSSRPPDKKNKQFFQNLFLTKLMMSRKFNWHQSFNKSMYKKGDNVVTFFKSLMKEIVNKRLCIQSSYPSNIK